MLKRIYIDNFRCLVNFDLSVDYINLFLGPNGSGKSTVFDALRKIQAFVSGDEKVSPLFQANDLTRWQTSPSQTFELQIEGNEGLYKYELTIEHDQAKNEARIASERLWFDNKPLVNAHPQGVQIYDDEHSESFTLPRAFSQSAVALFSSEHYTKLTWFRERMERFIYVQIDPLIMLGESNQEVAHVTARMEHFVSWYRYIYQDQSKAFEITESLREILQGFTHFKFIPAGHKQRLLRLHFSLGNDTHNTIGYGFDELSDGQRALVVLYSLVHYARAEDYTLCIDEPENFIALREIQPWLTLLYDFCGDRDLQALLISHHPELINYLAFAGYWFDRDHNNAPVRVKPVTDDHDTGLPISELVARGWLHE